MSHTNYSDQQAAQMKYCVRSLPRCLLRSTFLGPVGVRRYCSDSNLINDIYFSTSMAEWGLCTPYAQISCRSTALVLLQARPQVSFLCTEGSIAYLVSERNLFYLPVHATAAARKDFRFLSLVTIMLHIIR